MIRNCVLMLDILLPKHIPNRPHVWNINMFPNNDPSITLAYMFMHMLIAALHRRTHYIQVILIENKSPTVVFHRFENPVFSTRSKFSTHKFQLWPANITSKYHQLISSIQQGIAGPPGPVQQHHADGYLHRRRAGRHLAARAAAKVLDTGGGEARRLVFFWEVGQKWRIQKTWKSWKKFEKTGKERWLFWIYWLIMTVYWIEAVSKW